MSTSTLLIYIFIGASSLSYLMYAKAQRNAIALASGIALMVIPYFSIEMWLMLLLSLLIMALPFVIKV